MAKLRRPGAKLPAKQLAILAVARFAEPLALTSVFPYLPEMIESFGVKKNEVAKWAGVTSAAFSLSQSLTAVPWGRASDKIGRKPTIVIGLLSTMTCFIIWGLSTSLPMAILVRAISGAGNGNVGIIRTMVAEMVPEKELQPRAFSIMPLVWSIGSIFGPAFGGFFANPADHFPALFGNNTFLKKFPFALPNFIAAVFFLISVATATFFLKETLESRRHRQDWGLLIGRRLTRRFRRSSSSHGHTRRLSFVDGEATAPLLPTRARRESKAQVSDTSHPTAKPRISDIFTPQTSIALVSYTFLALHSVSYDQVLPVFLNYPLRDPASDEIHLPFKFSGGFGMNSGQIGSIFTVYGIACGLIQFVLFPPICNKFGALTCFKTCCLTFPIVYLVTPFTVLIQDHNIRYITLAVVLFVKAFAVIFGFPCITILLTNSAPSLSVLGTLNGFATSFSGLGRAFGPAITGAIFSWGVDNGYMISSWWFLGLTAIIGAIPAFHIIDGDALTQSPDSSDDDEEDGDDEYDDSEDAVLSDSEGEDDGETLQGSSSFLVRKDVRPDSSKSIAADDLPEEAPLLQAKDAELPSGYGSVKNL